MQSIQPRDEQSVVTRNAILTLCYSSKLFVCTKETGQFLREIAATRRTCNTETREIVAFLKSSHIKRLKFDF